MACNIKRDLYFGRPFPQPRLRKNRSWYFSRECEIAQRPEIRCMTDWIMKHDILLHKGILSIACEHRAKVPNKRFDNGLK